MIPFLAGAVAFIGAASAADAPVAPSAADAARFEYAAALQRAKAIGEARWAFTLTYTDEVANGVKSYTLRFDPRQPAGGRWLAVDPAAEKLSKDERKAFKRMSRNDDADDALVYDRLAETAAQAGLVSVDDDDAVFSIPITDPNLPEKARAALSATVRLDRKAGYVSSVEVLSKAPFKPAAIARVDSMRQSQVYAPAGPNGEILLISSQSQSAGEAMMKSFNSNVRMAYSDFEKVDAPPRAPKK